MSALKLFIKEIYNKENNCIKNSKNKLYAINNNIRKKVATIVLGKKRRNTTLCQEKIGKHECNNNEESFFRPKTILFHQQKIFPDIQHLLSL